MPNAVLYTRFSPRPNEDECESILTQLDVLRKYAAQHKMTIKKEIADKAIRGTDKNRQNLWAAIDELAKGEVLLIYAWDRLSRDKFLHVLVEEELKKKGARIISVTEPSSCLDTPESNLIRTLLQAFSVYEREILSARMKAALARRRENEEFFARVPYGYSGYEVRDGKKYLVRDDYEQEVLMMVLHLFHNEHLSYRKIVKRLREMGYKHRKKAKSWSLSTIHNIVNHYSFRLFDKNS